MLQQLFKGSWIAPYSDMRKFTDVYIEDIAIFSDSLKEHLQPLEKVFQLLADNKIFAKKSKCALSD